MFLPYMSVVKLRKVTMRINSFTKLSKLFILHTPQQKSNQEYMPQHLGFTFFESKNPI